jgi:hypothetical protein
VNAVQTLKQELENLGVVTNIDPLDEDDLVSLRLTFPSGVVVDLMPAQDVPGEDGIDVIEVSVAEQK